MTEEVSPLLKLLTLLLVITGPAAFGVVAAVAIMSTRNLSQRAWQRGVIIIAIVGVLTIFVLTPIAWRWAPWALIS